MLELVRGANMVLHLTNPLDVQSWDDQRIVSALATSAEERYQEFVHTYPSIALRVPQWMLASYLGVSPETLSRVRKSLSRK